MKNVRVFISYAREDSTAARRLYQELRKVPGILPWIDTEDLRYGQDWKSEIADAMRASEFIVLLASSKSIMKEGYVQREVRDAIELSKEKPHGRIFLIPVKLDDCNPSFPELKGLHWGDLKANWDKGVARILDSIRGEDRLNTDPVLAYPVLKAKQEPTDLPIGLGLHSVMQIIGGTIRYTKASVPIPDDLTVTIKAGSLHRNESDAIEAILWTFAPFASLSELNRKLGLDRIRLTSESRTLSSDPNNPTIFTSQKVIVVPKGSITENLQTKQTNILPIDLTMSMVVEAAGYLIGTRFVGTFKVQSRTREFPFVVEMEGDVDLNLR